MPVGRPPVRPARLIGTRFGGGAQIRRIEIIFAGNSDQREQGVAPGVGQRRPIRWGAAVSLTGHTGQSDETHSPDECASTVVSRMSPASSIAVVCTVAISCLPRALRTISRPLASEA